MPMRRLLKPLAAGLITSTVGLVLSLTVVGLYLEENLGNHALFHFRGPRQAPSQVVLVTMDNSSAEYFGMPPEPKNWPRSLHAQLVRRLAREGAAVIVFDLAFEDHRSAEQDSLFAEAIREAGNVVLFERLKLTSSPLVDKKGQHVGDVNVARQVRPIPSLGQSAFALAPFPLPKIPVEVNQYWTFVPGIGNKPSLPVAAFQTYSADAYEDFVRLIRTENPESASELPRDQEAFRRPGSVERVASVVRDVFETESNMEVRLLARLDSGDFSDSMPDRKRVLRSLVRMYGGEDSVYLNFYGPPGTITSVPYSRLIPSPEEGVEHSLPVQFKGKAVFIGVAEKSGTDQRDGFYTVFSKSNGVDLSGVEIAATAFGNILEDMPLRPVSLPLHLTVVVAWGFLAGILGLLMNVWLAALVLLLAGLAYFAVALNQFTHSGAWFPVVIPLLVETPLGLFGAVCWKYLVTSRERRNMRKAIGYYLPDKVVDQLVQNKMEVKPEGQIVYGTCVCTDGERYSTLSEIMEPKELSDFMNRYYETLFTPVKERGGTVSDVVGDAMLAIWATTEPDPEMTRKACHAALDIARAVGEFNRSRDVLKLPTRIGLNFGVMSLGNIGGVNHYEYRPVGDVVNTAARIEGLNKLLGTQILMSGEVLSQLDGFVTRDVGHFVLAGKVRPVSIHELLCRGCDVTGDQEALCTIFMDGLNAYRGQCWGDARQILERALEVMPEDGPSRFYLNLCGEHLKDPPGRLWDGTIRLKSK